MDRQPDFTPIQPLALPQLEAIQTEQIEVEGKQAQVTLGLVPAGARVPTAASYIYGAGVITERKRLGFPPDALGELFGWIEFGREWTIEKNKRDLLDDLTSLEQIITQRFQSLIVKAIERRVARGAARWSAKVLNERLRRLPYKGKSRKERRPGPHRQVGTVKPTGTGGKRTTATDLTRGRRDRKTVSEYAVCPFRRGR